ncbi:MAG: DUF4097 family beta strand repeat-containing protein [Acidobacteriota bacterium]
MRRLAIAAALSLTALTASATTLEEKFDRTFDVRPGARVSLANVNGNITIRAWDQPRVRIQAQKKVHASGAQSAKEAMADLKIEIVPSDGGLRVITRYPKRGDGLDFLDWMFGGGRVNASVTYEVDVPRTMSLDLDNTNGGIEVSDIRGSHRIETTNGRISLARCAGDIEAATTNGAIRAELLHVTPGKAMRLSTTNGRISLSAPPTFAAHVDASTTNGSINTELPISTTKAGRHSLRGDINGGGPELRLRTTNGSIEILAAR